MAAGQVLYIFFLSEGAADPLKVSQSSRPSKAWRNKKYFFLKKNPPTANKGRRKDLKERLPKRPECTMLEKMVGSRRIGKAGRWKNTITGYFWAGEAQRAAVSREAWKADCI
uniref:Uncharacterized protein n=1 Tax=Anser cygnoides TaxID=8845 RepID=A0A8B9IFH5_ANSCY